MRLWLPAGLEAVVLCLATLFAAPRAEADKALRPGASEEARPEEARPEKARLRNAGPDSVRFDKARALQREVDRLASWVGANQGELGLLVVDIDSGRALASHDEDRALNPASNAKILTAVTAIDVLGADHRFRFGLYGVVKDGYASRIVLRSDGDPSVTARDLEKLAKRLVDDGLRRVGDILVDQGAFDEKFTPPAFEQQPDEWAPFRAPVSAVAIGRNALVVRVEPGPRGKPARVTVDPAGYLDIESSVPTKKKGSGRKLVLDMQPNGRLLSGKLTGWVSQGDRAVSFEKRIDDPTLFAGFVLRALLTKMGASVQGSVLEGGKDETHLLIERRSEPLSALLAELGKQSDNYYAETLLKAAGARSSRKRGTSADGAKAVQDELARLGALEPGTRVVNGSGLFDANRSSAATLVKVLAASAARGAFLDQLAVGGVDGTLRHRFRGTRGRVRAKTGTLARAHTLSGYALDSRGKPRVAFAILINGIATKAAEQRRRIDRIVELALPLAH